jgi:hypothetical protein
MPIASISVTLNSRLAAPPPVSDPALFATPVKPGGAPPQDTVSLSSGADGNNASQTDMAATENHASTYPRQQLYPGQKGYLPPPISSQLGQNARGARLNTKA